MALQMFSPGGGNQLSTITFICAAWLLARVAAYFIYENVPFIHRLPFLRIGDKCYRLVAILNLHFAMFDICIFQQRPAVFARLAAGQNFRKTLHRINNKRVINPVSESPSSLFLFFFSPSKINNGP